MVKPIDIKLNDAIRIYNEVKLAREFVVYDGVTYFRIEKGILVPIAAIRNGRDGVLEVT